MTVAFVVVAALVLILLRVPVAISLLTPSVLYIAFATPLQVTAVVERATASLNGFALLAVPLFILVGNVANLSGVANAIFDFAQRIVGRVRGGLGYVDVLSSLGFSWMSGSAVSDVAVIGSVQVPQMQKRGYSNVYIGGMTSAASLVTPLMPPSIPAIMYGVVSGVSVGALFLGSVVPTFCIVAILLFSVWIYARKRDDLRNTGPTEGTFWGSLVRIVPYMFAPVLILGGILSGLFTPTEAAGAAAAYLVVVSMILRPGFGPRQLWTALKRTASTTGSVMVIVASASVFGWVLTLERIPQSIATWAVTVTDSPLLFMVLIVFFLILIGTIIDPISGILIVTPILAPIAAQFGIDPVHFGVVVIFSLLIGLFTPPVGLVLFVLESVTTLKMSEIMRGVSPFVLIYVLFALMLVSVPFLTTGLAQMIAP